MAMRWFASGGRSSGATHFQRGPEFKKEVVALNLHEITASN
jgi:hypothetical protein